MWPHSSSSFSFPVGYLLTIRSANDRQNGLPSQFTWDLGLVVPQVSLVAFAFIWFRHSRISPRFLIRSGLHSGSLVSFCTAHVRHSGWQVAIALDTSSTGTSTSRILFTRWRVVQGPRRCAFLHISAGKAPQLAEVYRHLASRVGHWKPPAGPRQCASCTFQPGRHHWCTGSWHQG